MHGVQRWWGAVIRGARWGEGVCNCNATRRRRMRTEQPPRVAQCTNFRSSDCDGDGAGVGREEKGSKRGEKRGKKNHALSAKD